MPFARHIVSALLCALLALPALGQPAGDRGGKRVTVLISDTHFGVGKTVRGKWHPYEDARWPIAFQGFLSSLDEYPEDVDLVILGDVIELWQPAPEMPCSVRSATVGCTKEEVRNLVSYILGQHVSELAAISQFAAKKGNRVHIVPGNHDAALLLPEIWGDFQEKLGDAAAGRVVLVRTGVWASADGKIIGEHGHQIGEDVNGYKPWPNGITTDDGGVTHMTRTWGENFVQSLFNQQEARIEFIDNLSPESAGLKYKLKTEGVVVVAGDLAKFLRYNLFGTSVAQKSQSLGHDGEFVWDDARAREAGHRLFEAALPAYDPLREEIQAREDVRTKLDSELKDPSIVSADEVQSLCMHATAKGNDTICGNGTLSAGIEGLIYTKKQVLAKHVGMRRGTFKSATTFVYGHTHQVEEPHELVASDGQGVWVSNTGAFQRVVHEKQFKQIQKDLRETNPSATLSLESLPACYSFIEVKDDVSNQWWWVQRESQVQGERVGARDAACWVDPDREA